MRPALRAAGGLVVCGIVLAACGGPATTSPTGSTAPAPAGQAATGPVPSGQPPNTALPAGAIPGQPTLTIGSDRANDSSAKLIAGRPTTDLDLKDNLFDPTVLVGSPGQQVVLELKNNGVNLHNFSLPAQSIDQDVQPGQKLTVTVTVPSSGTFEFVCKYHRATGMVGALTAT